MTSGFFGSGALPSRRKFKKPWNSRILAIQWTDIFILSCVFRVYVVESSHVLIPPAWLSVKILAAFGVVYILLRHYQNSSFAYSRSLDSRNRTFQKTEPLFVHGFVQCLFSKRKRFYGGFPSFSSSDSRQR